ncbi:MAG: helix-turn-helix transcriptional regulator [Phycisphaeraceae bacterium]|nr:MAG: helix-turn-helix transcriptional regulator [Phycisphaeraceae bacterium]
MASVFQHPPATPRQAARRRSRLDRVLDPALFKALGEPTRAKVLACLVKCGRACSVTEVAECCSVDFSMVARHLGALSRAGVLRSRKEGRTVWYEAAPDLARRFREIADAIEEWTGTGCCGDEGCGCEPGKA